MASHRRKQEAGPPSPSEAEETAERQRGNDERDEETGFTGQGDMR
jgi:hypothetical protein